MIDIDLDDTEILERLGEIEKGRAYRHFRPLSEAANEYIHWAETPELRVYTGIKVFDDAMRGTAPGELTLIQGFTHSGKTLLTTEILLNNAHVPICVFTPDETRPLVLTKLTAADTGVGARELEERIQRDDQSARELLLATAEKFSKLAIFDETVSLSDMDRMFVEVTDAFGERPKAVVFDYAGLLDGFEDPARAIEALKAWGKRHQVPMFVLHQASRTSGSSGKKMNIDSGSFGGEQQATHVIGVRRKKYMHYANIALLKEKIAGAVNPKSIDEFEAKIREIEFDLLPHDMNTVTPSLVKNKRPPCDLVDDYDMEIEVGTGRLRPPARKTVDAHGNVVNVRKADLSFLKATPAWEERGML